MKAQETFNLFSKICIEKFKFGEGGTKPIISFLRLPLNKDKFTAELGNYNIVDYSSYSDNQGDWETMTVHFIDCKVYISERHLYLDGIYQDVYYFVMKKNYDNTFELTKEEIYITNIPHTPLFSYLTKVGMTMEGTFNDISEKGFLDQFPDSEFRNVSKLTGLGEVYIKTELVNDFNKLRKEMIEQNGHFPIFE